MSKKKDVKTPGKSDAATQGYEKPKVKTFTKSDVLSAVNKGAKFPARGFAG